MSTAARKQRKTVRQSALAVDRQHGTNFADGTAFQHPTRDGIPYGRSKQPNLMNALPSPQRIEATADLIQVARNSWGWWS